MSDDLAKTSTFLGAVQYMTLAVIQDDGKPWAVPVHIQKREGMSFFWDSPFDTVHSRAIARSPDVMLMMYQSANGEVEEFGFYADATATLVETLPDGRGRYRADVTQAWINDEKHLKRELHLEN